MTFCYSCDFNKYTLRYLKKLSVLRQNTNGVQATSDGEENDNSDDTDEEELMLMG